MAAPLEKATVAELDALASEHAIPDYPADANKPEKLAHLQAALGDDFEFETPPTYRLTLVEGVNAAQFNVAGVEIDLDTASPVYETSHQPTFKALLELPFLKEA